MTPDELKQFLARLQAPYAANPASWPDERVEALLALPEAAAQTEADHDLLELVAHAFQRNEDIQRAYPHFYQRLQRNPTFRDALLEILEMMEDGEDE